MNFADSFVIVMFLKKITKSQGKVNAQCHKGKHVTTIPLWYVGDIYGSPTSGRQIFNHISFVKGQWKHCFEIKIVS